MESQTQFSTSPVNNVLTSLEYLLSEGHCSTEINHSWGSDVFSEPIQNYQNHHWVQETQANRNIHQSPEELKPVYQNLNGSIPVLPSVSYEQTNCFSNFQVYATNQPRHMAIQEQSHLQTLTYNRIHQGSFGCNQQKKTSLKSISKRKRKRTMFTTEQVEVLEKVFLTKPYINRDERQALVEELQINDKVIKVWFQNRRLKEKREAEEAAEESTQEMYTPHAQTGETQYKFDELSYVESRIHHTDKFGYVTLDERAINGLVKVIDNIVSQEAELNMTIENQDDTVLGKPQENIVTPVESESSSGSIYEPISPASSDCTSSEESTSYEPLEPKESLQIIFDIQEFLVFNKK